MQPCARRWTYVCNHTALAATSVGKQNTASYATHTNVVRLAMRAHTPATMMTAWPSLWPVPPSMVAVCTSRRVPAAMAETVLWEARGGCGQRRALWRCAAGALDCGGGSQLQRELAMVRDAHKLQALCRGRVRVPASLGSPSLWRPGRRRRLTSNHDAHLPSQNPERPLGSAAANATSNGAL